MADDELQRQFEENLFRISRFSNPNQPQGASIRDPRDEERAEFAPEEEDPRLGLLLDMLPGIGQARSVAQTGRSLGEGDLLGALGGAAAFIPVGAMATKGGRVAGTISEILDRLTRKGGKIKGTEFKRVLENDLVDDLIRGLEGKAPKNPPINPDDFNLF